MKNNINFTVHPKSLLDEIKALQRRNMGKSVNLPKFLFLCGRDISITGISNRNLITMFYNRAPFTNIHCILAEDLWPKENKKEIDLLTFEDFLAEISDGIVLFVESFGTACELGAFSMKENLIKKMIVFIDEKYNGVNSFINDGPISKVAKINVSNVIYTDLDAIFSSQETLNKLNQIAAIKKCDINRDKKSVKVNSFTLEILEIISLFGPIDKKELISIYKYLKDFDNFTFVSEYNNEPIKSIQPFHIIKFLQNFQLVTEENDMVNINAETFKFLNFMFEINYKEFNYLRATLLSRKYRYKAGITA